MIGTVAWSERGAWRLAALAAVAAAIAACTNATVTTTGALDPGMRVSQLSVPGGARSNHVRVSPDEQTLVISTAGHGREPPRLVVYNAELQRAADADLVTHDIAFASDGRRIIVGVGTLTTLSLPDLRTASGPPSTGIQPTAHMMAFATAGVQEIIERPDASGWFAAARRGEDGIVEIRDDATLSIGRRGKFGDGSLRAAALDVRTGRLVLLLKPNFLELFDTREMRSTRRVELPCTSVGFAVAVADGVAFVPTEQGTVMVADVSDGKLLNSVEVGGRQVTLAMSRSGATLAVATRDLQDDGSTRVGLHVFARRGGDLTPIAATECRLKHPPNDIEVIEGSRVVILACDETLAWHY